MRTSSIFVPALLAVFIGLGCGGPTAPASPATSNAAATSTATPASSGTNVLELGDATIVLADDAAHPRTVTVHADGKVEVSGKTVGTLKSDGHFVAADGSFDVAIDADGKVGKKKQIVIDADGATHLPDGGVLKLGSDGHLLDDKGKDTGITVTAATPGARRAAMLVLLVATTGGSSTTTSGPGCPMVKGSKMSGGPSTCSCTDHNQGSSFSLDCDEAGTKQCVCKKDGAVVKTVPATTGTCNDTSVWQQKCGFPAHPEPAPEL